MYNVLVVGGAGYIGSHIVRDLSENNYNAIIYDNLTEGHREAINGRHFIHADIDDTGKLDEVFEQNKIDMVMHFSAYAYVGESVENPEKYYKNNVCGTINLLSSMLKHRVTNFIFSSSCATYGNPVYVPIDEQHPQKPINPYGATKLMVERIIDDYSKAYGLNYMALRYFNAAGAHPDARTGESHRIETHLIPLVLKTLTGEKDKVHVFGSDYDTPDGTCIRDYIHVCDLAAAHRLAMEKLLSGGENNRINLGTAVGTSVKEIISACEEVTGSKVPAVYADRRPGDPAVLTASNEYAKKTLGWVPQYTDIKDIIKTAWAWEKNRKY
jgi:UDP-glucose 4-epimerase